MTDPNWQVGLPGLVQSYYLPTPVDGKLLGWVGQEIVNYDQIIPPPQDVTATWGGLAGGSVNALTISPVSAITSYTAGQTFRFTAGSVNTGPATISVSGLAAIPILTITGNPLSGGEIQPGLVEIVYDGSAFRSVTVGTSFGFIQNSAYAMYRTVQAKLRENKSIEDFGGIGDGVTDSTPAFIKAKSFIESTGNNVLIPEGTYLTDPFALDSQFYDLQGTFYGVSKLRSIIKRKTAGASPFITIGSSSGTVFQANIGLSNLTIDGGLSSNGDAFVGYDVVRSGFDNVRFKGGAVACHLFGGISVSFNNCTFDLAATGFRAEKFTSLAGGGYPNLIGIIGGEIVDNSTLGVYFDHGMVFSIKNCDIEGNGTTLGAAGQGGVIIGPNIGEAVFATDTSSPGLTISGGWCEANKGVAGILLQSGINSVSNMEFFNQSTEVTNDIKIDGGNYFLRNLNMAFAKTANVLEGASVLDGNAIEYVQASALSYNTDKTTVNSGNRIFLRQGLVPSVNNMTQPLFQTGSDTSGVNPSITFNVPYKSGTTPKINLTPINNNAATIDMPEAYNVTRTGFTIRKKSFNGTTIGTVNYQVDWEALGEAP